MEVEQLLSLSGPALAQAVSSLLETPGLYVFSDILELPNVREMENGPHAPMYQLLNLFAYGTYCDYKALLCGALEELSELPSPRVWVSSPGEQEREALETHFLPDSVLWLLKELHTHLRVPASHYTSDLASNLKCLPYSLLLQQLELKNVRELEDLLIDAVYCDIIQGKLDQRNQQVEVDCSVGRDLAPTSSQTSSTRCRSGARAARRCWCGIEEQVSRANQYRESQLKVKVQVETEVSNLQKTLKASAASPKPRQPGKKSSKVKGLRGSGKIWSKSN
ncbi:hypothetical protein KUCAC02_014560 [Chaenocephalus aceratus]|uniref:Uncharacterized protein n=1 Tax=Chaenocephalus aceratus TaxID=36190 RepID=A0ACB9WEX7_CHAAC|nr:hypothetical protein KUCAC02_014560 [Chaenocephalus aceratus]